jgi:hypothetical protein
MEHPLIAALEHPLIVALRHAGLTTQQKAQQLLHDRTIPGSEPEFAALVDALLFDQRCAGGQDGRGELSTRGIRYRVKRHAASALHVYRSEIMDALVSIPLADRRRIIISLAAGTGNELAMHFQADRSQLITGIEAELQNGMNDHSAALLLPQPPR